MEHSTTATFRPYDATGDVEGARRVWRECGWLDPGQAPSETLDTFLIGADEAWVAEVDGEVEALVVGFIGDMHYAGRRIPVGVIGAVTASLVVRRQGVAGRLTAHVVQQLATRGTVLNVLGIFDQGYYDKLGFGQGPYDHFVCFDPAKLLVPGATRTPVRLSIDDLAEVHASRLGRLRMHGSVSIPVPGVTAKSMRNAPNGMGLGFRDDSGRLTHCLWLSRGNPEEGPWRCRWQTFETWDQFVELLGLLKNLGDQLYLVRMYEPAPFQLQSVLDRPLRSRLKTFGGRFWERVETLAWSQFRVDDVAAAVAAMKPTTSVRFNLRLTDPITSKLGDSEITWTGVGGDYTIALVAGKGSTATLGEAAGLPTLEASVNTFTQWWLGVTPATTLAALGDFSAPGELLRALDSALTLPRPCPDWDF